MQELIKQNGTVYDVDSVPKIGFWDFYYQDDKTKKWNRCMVLDSDCVQAQSRTDSGPVKFIYKKEEPFAKSLSEILHIQFGDGNNKPPFLYHSIRSLGWILFDVVHMMNRLRCQFTQKVFEDMMLMIRAMDPADRSRLEQIDIGPNRMVVPEGLSFVSKDQRYTPDWAAIQGLLAQNKQLMGEASSAYTQDIDSGTEKERTKFEVQVLLAQTAKLPGTMLNLAYIQEVFAYEDICRRLTLQDSPEPDTKKFLNHCKHKNLAEKGLDST